MKLYVYCLVEKIDALLAPVSGVSGAPVDLIRLDDFSFLVTQLEGDSAPPVTRDNVLAHDAVVRSVLNETTPLPFRFGTVQTESHLRSYIRTHRTALEAKLAVVRGCVEMSVKIISNLDESDLETTSERTEEGPGGRFLNEKRREILGGERRAKEAREVAAWLKEQVGSFVRQEAISLCPTEKLIVAAAHLVVREQVTKYRGGLAIARNARPELHFLVSGPWPPYTFSNIELEFKTRFGVS
ncbi:MAG TPA: GvpL/GvpF family gas vesicle protein [Pyrinomonadaceae bacterium]|nr:GvpL/GvpF family gas vesicle protein [Pyrinomonadaceae bacterium]